MSFELESEILRVAPEVGVDKQKSLPVFGCQTCVQGNYSFTCIAQGDTSEDFAGLDRQCLTPNHFKWLEHTVFAGADAEQVLGIHDMAAVGVGK